MAFRRCVKCAQVKLKENFPVDDWTCHSCLSCDGPNTLPPVLDPRANEANDDAVKNADEFAGASSIENSPSCSSSPSYGLHPTPASSTTSRMRIRLPIANSLPSKPIQSVDSSKSPKSPEVISKHFPTLETISMSMLIHHTSPPNSGRGLSRSPRQESAKHSCTEEVASFKSPSPSDQNWVPGETVSIAGESSPSEDSLEERPKRCHILLGHKNNVTAVAFTPDCTRLVTASRDMHLRLWDIANNKVLDKFVFKKAEKGDNKINCVAISPDGKHLASGGSDKLIHMFELNDGAFSQPKLLEGHQNWVLALAFSPMPVTRSSPQLASGSSDGLLFMWPLGDNSSTLSPNHFAEEGYKDWVTSVTFCKDGYHVVTGCRDHNVRIWNTRETTCVPELVLTFHTDWVNSVSCLPGTNLLLTGSRDGHVCIWNYDPHEVLDPNTPLSVCDIHAHQSRITAVAWSPDGKQVVSVCADGCVRIWDTSDGSLVKELQGHQGRITSVAWSPDGMLLATGCCDRTARIWDVSTSILPGDLPLHTTTATIPMAPVTPHGPIAKWLPAGMAHQKPEPFLMAFMVEKYIRFGYWFTSLAHSDDGTLLAGGSCDRSIYIWSSFHQAPTLLKGHTDWVTAVAFVGNKYLISGSRDQTVRVWDIELATQLKVWHDQKGTVSSVAYCAKTSKVISGSHDGSICLWDLKTPMGPDKKVQKVVKPAVFAPHKQEKREHVYTAWNKPSICGQKLNVESTAQVTSVAYSADGKMIASGRMDGSVHLHFMDQSTPTFTRILLPGERMDSPPNSPTKASGENDEATLVAFDSHGVYLAAATPQFALRVWKIDDEESHVELEFNEAADGIATALAFGCAMEHTLVAVGVGQCTYVFDLKDKLKRVEQQNHQSNITALSWCFSKCNKIFTLASASHDKSVRLWYDPMGKGPQEIFYGHSGVAAASRDGSQVVVLDDQAVWVQGANNPYDRFRLEGTGVASQGYCGVHALTYSPDGTHIAGVDGSNSILLWNRSNGVRTRTTEPQQKIITCLAYMEGNKLLVAGMGRTILVLDLDIPDEERITQHIPNHHTPTNYVILSMAYSSEQRLIATGGADHRIVIGGVTADYLLEPHYKLAGHGGDVTAVAFCNDGSRLVSGSADRTVRIWDTTTKHEIGQFHTSMVVFALTATTGTSHWNCTTLCSSQGCQTVHFYPIAQTGLPLVVAAKEGTFHELFLSEGGWFAIMQLLCKALAPNKLFIEELIKVAEPEWVLSAAAVILHAAMEALDVEFLHEFARSFTQAITDTNAKLHDPVTEGSYRYLYPSVLRYLSLAPVMRKMAEEYPEELLVLLNCITLLEAVHTMHSKVAVGVNRFVVCGTTSLQPTAVKFPKPLFTEILEFFSKGPFSGAMAQKAAEFHVQKVNATHGLVPFCVEPLIVTSSSEAAQPSPFLDQLVAINNPEMFQSIPIQALVEYKWQAYARRRFVLDFLIYLAGLLGLVVMGYLVVGSPVVNVWQRLKDHEDTPWDALLLVAALFVVASAISGIRHEIIQLRCASAPNGLLSYFYDAWNWIQWTQLMLSAASVVTFFVGYNSTQLLLGLSIYLRWFLILFYLQPFEGTGALVRMILKIVYDIKFFLIILGIAVLAGANSFYVLVRACEDDTEGTSTENDCSNAFQDPSGAFFTMFNMFLLNAFDVGSFAVGPYNLVLQVLFVISMVLVPIILLNLLIALMGDSFQRINERASMELTLLRAKIILEVELFMSDEEKQKPDVSPPYLHVFVRRDGNTAVEKEKDEDRD